MTQKNRIMKTKKTYYGLMLFLVGLMALITILWSPKYFTKVIFPILLIVFGILFWIAEAESTILCAKNKTNQQRKSK